MGKLCIEAFHCDNELLQIKSNGFIDGITVIYKMEISGWKEMQQIQLQIYIKNVKTAKRFVIYCIWLHE